MSAYKSVGLLYTRTVGRLCSLIMSFEMYLKAAKSLDCAEDFSMFTFEDGANDIYEISFSILNLLRNERSLFVGLVLIV